MASSSNSYNNYSSLPGGRPNPAAVIVCIDVPDPDNFLMALRVIRDYEHCDSCHVHIVLSPRPVSFAAIPYGPMLPKLQGKCESEKMKNIKPRLIGRITQDDVNSWVQEFNDEEQKWLYVDEDFKNPQVQEDTDLYMKITRIRLLKFLDAHKIPHDKYSLYTDTDYKNCPILPGMRHALHTADFSFDFGDLLIGEEALSVARSAFSGVKLTHFEEMRQKAREKTTANQSSPERPAIYPIDLFQAAVTHDPDYEDGSKRSQQRRKDTHLLSDIYLQMHRKIHNYNSQKYHTINDLTKKFKGGRHATKPLIYVGGPFTETLKIINDLGPKQIGPIIAMAGATHGQSNIFSNQFNILIDPSSAEQVLRFAADKQIDLNLLPTECAKGSAYDIKDGNEFETEIGSQFKAVGTLYSQWSPSPSRPVTLFDLLAAMTVTTDLYKGMLRSVEFEIQDDKFQFTEKPHHRPSFMRKITHSGTFGGPGLKMFWNERINGSFKENDYMAERRPAFFKEVKWTLMDYKTPKSFRPGPKSDSCSTH